MTTAITIDKWEAMIRHPAVGFVQEYVSVSRLQVYEQCPQKFFFEYVTKPERVSEADSTRAELGSVVHAALEGVYKWVMEQEFSGVIPEKVFTDCYREAFKSHESDLVGIKLYDEGLQIVRKYFDRNPDVDCWSVLAVEQEFMIEVAPGVFVKGFMDRVDVEDGHIVIHDYKTNAQLYTREDLRANLQAGVYLLIARKLWPNAKSYRFVFDMLLHDQQQGTNRTIEELRIVRGYIVDLVAKIEQPHQDWKAKLSVLCGWCGQRGRCEAFRRAAEEGAEYLHANEENTVEAVALERVKIDAVEKALGQRKKEIDKILKAKILAEDPSGRTGIEYPGVSYRVININRTTIPVERVIELVSKAAGVTPEEVRSKLVDPLVSKTKTDEIVAEYREQIGTAKRATLSMMLVAESEQTFAFAKLDARVDKGPKLPKEENPKELPSPDQGCSFCKARPAKRVDRSGAIFFVCEEHAKKRKPPA